MARTNNERSNDIAVNTYGITSRNFELGTALAINYFNKMAVISIHPARETRGDYPSFDFNEGVRSYISAKDAKIIVKKGRKAIKKLEAGEEFKGFAIPLKRGLIEVIQASELKKKIKSVSGDVDPSDICVVIYTDMNDDKTTDKYLVHVFNKDITIHDYDSTSGNYNTESDNYEFEHFLDALESFSVSITNGIAHGIKEEGKYQRRRIERMAFELASSLGVDFSKSANTNRSSNSRGVGWNSGSNGEGLGVSSRGSDGQSAEIVDATDEQDLDSVIESMID